MKLKELIKELEETKNFQEFKNENPKAIFTAGFFVFDLIEEKEKISLDYFLDSKKKIASFEFPFDKPKFHEDEITNASKQDISLKIDICDLKEKCSEIIKENNSSIKPTKIIAIIQNNIWNLTCMDNALGIVQIKLNASSGETIKFNKGSLMDFMGIKKSNSF